MAISTLTSTACTAAPTTTILHLSPEKPLSRSKSIFHNAITPPSNNKNQHPNRHSLPNSSTIWEQHQQRMVHHPTIVDIGSSLPPSPLSPSRRAGGSRLSLDTSQERLQNITIIKDGDKSYLKLFSPVLVESPVSYLSTNQLFDDKKLWENGPDEVLQKKLEGEKTEAFKARFKQQVRGFMLGLWLGCLMGLVILQQTGAKMFIPTLLARRDTSPLMLLIVIISWAAVFRSGTRCMMAAITTCIAALTFFAAVIVNQSPHSAESHVYRSVQAAPFASNSHTLL